MSNKPKILHALFSRQYKILIVNPQWEIKERLLIAVKIPLSLFATSTSKIHHHTNASIFSFKKTYSALVDQSKNVCNSELIPFSHGWSKSKKFDFEWDLNPRPLDWHSNTLPTELFRAWYDYNLRYSFQQSNPIQFKGREFESHVRSKPVVNHFLKYHHDFPHLFDSSHQHLVHPFSDGKHLSTKKSSLEFKVS